MCSLMPICSSVNKLGDRRSFQEPIKLAVFTLSSGIDLSALFFPLVFCVVSLLGLGENFRSQNCDEKMESTIPPKTRTSPVLMTQMPNAEAIPGLGSLTELASKILKYI